MSDPQIRDDRVRLPVTEKSSGRELFSCFDGLAVAEGHVDVAFAVHREVIRQSVEIADGECDQCFRQFLKGGEEILDAAFLGLCLADLLVQILDTLFEAVVPGGQAVVLFVVSGLFQSDMGACVDVLLDGIATDLRFFQQPVPLDFLLGGVKEQSHHLSSVGDDRFLVGQQLVCR